MSKKKFLSNKKAVSHIEIITSFVIFVLFVFFILYYLNPVRHQNINSVLFSVLQDNIKEEASVILFETPLILNNPSDIQTCFIVPSPYTGAANISVSNQNKEQIYFEQYGANSLAITKSSGEIYYIYYSPYQTLENVEIGGGFGSCYLLNFSSDYSFSSTRNYNLYSIKKLKELNFSYYNDYDGLKKGLNFPVGNDFNIYISRLGENIKIVSMESTKPEKIEVFALEIPVQLMEDTGEISSGILNLQVW